MGLEASLDPAISAKHAPTIDAYWAKDRRYQLKVGRVTQPYRKDTMQQG